MLECAKCSAPINTDPTNSRLPPWCPRCGADLQTRAAGPQPTMPGDPLADVGSHWSPMYQREAKTPAPAEPTTGVTLQAGAAPAPPLAEPAAASPVPDAPLPTPPAADDPFATSTRYPRRPGTTGALVIGVVFLLLAGVIGYWSFQKATTYQKVTGTVVRMVPGRKGSVYPVVGYTVNGREYTTQGSSSGGPGVGEAVEVLYPPSDPGNGTLNTFSNVWLPPLVPGGIGAAALSLWFFAGAQRGRQPSAP
jgi:hypothetical protein